MILFLDSTAPKRWHVVVTGLTPGVLNCAICSKVRDDCRFNADLNDLLLKTPRLAQVEGGCLQLVPFLRLHDAAINVRGALQLATAKKMKP